MTSEAFQDEAAHIGSKELADCGISTQSAFVVTMGKYLHRLRGSLSQEYERSDCPAFCPAARDPHAGP